MASAEERPFGKRARAWIRQHKWWIVPALGVLYVLVWWLVPFALYRRTGTPKVNELDAITSTRTALLAGLIGVGALLTFWLNSRTHRLTEQGQITDRYTKAIEQLGSDKLDVRLGGIYALERIAVDSERDHPTVVEVLSAFVREHSQPAHTSAGQPTIAEVLAALFQRRNESASAHQPNPDRSTENEPEVSSSLRRPTTDVQAALTVLGRLPEVANVSRGDLTGASLAGANLVEMNLAGAYLAKVNLVGADMAKVNLAGAFLGKAKLAGGNLAEANLAGADLAEADLADAKLKRANLAKAKLGKANLTSADLTRANLVRAGLTEADLPDADLTEADLTKAWLVDANLAGARIVGANLEGASLVHANLSNASFFVATPKGTVSFSKRSPANLTGTLLLGTNLSGVNLVGLDLSETMDLTQEQLALAHGNDHIPLPEEVRRPDSWMLSRSRQGPARNFGR